MPIMTMAMIFKILNMDMALDKNSYFRENAQNTVPIKYITKPRMSIVFFPPIPHFLKNTSPMTSKAVAKRIKQIAITFRINSDAINYLWNLSY